MLRHPAVILFILMLLQNGLANAGSAINADCYPGQTHLIDDLLQRSKQIDIDLTKFYRRNDEMYPHVQASVRIQSDDGGKKYDFRTFSSASIDPVSRNSKVEPHSILDSICNLNMQRSDPLPVIVDGIDLSNPSIPPGHCTCETSVRGVTHKGDVRSHKHQIGMEHNDLTVVNKTLTYIRSDNHVQIPLLRPTTDKDLIDTIKEAIRNEIFSYIAYFEKTRDERYQTKQVTFSSRRIDGSDKFELTIDGDTDQITIAIGNFHQVFDGSQKDKDAAIGPMRKYAEIFDGPVEKVSSDLAFVPTRLKSAKSTIFKPVIQSPTYRFVVDVEGSQITGYRHVPVGLFSADGKFIASARIWTHGIQKK